MVSGQGGVNRMDQRNDIGEFNKVSLQGVPACGRQERTKPCPEQSLAPHGVQGGAKEL
jgi:hypothetical protein